MSTDAACRAETSSDDEEGVISLPETHLPSIELLLDKAVAVEVVGRLEGKERRHTQDEGPENFIADVEEEKKLWVKRLFWWAKMR